MVEAARRHQRVVQIGTQRRGSPAFTRLADVVGSGKKEANELLDYEYREPWKQA